MLSPKEDANPAEGIRYACGMNRTTLGKYKDYEMGPGKTRRWYADSPVGEIEVTTSVEVLELTVERAGLVPALPLQMVPLLRLEMTVVPIDDSETHPESWKVVYRDNAESIIIGLEEYLKQYCPAPDHVLETLQSFDYAIQSKA
jgi:hypothetical protein